MMKMKMKNNIVMVKMMMMRKNSMKMRKKMSQRKKDQKKKEIEDRLFCIDSYFHIQNQKYLK